MKSVVAVLFLIAGVCLCNEEAAAQTRPLQKMQQKRKENRADRLVEEGFALMEKGNAALAAEKFQEALSLNPKNARAHAQLAFLAWQSGRDAVAQYHAEIALKIQPDNPRAHLVLANVFIKNGKDLEQAGDSL